MARNEIFSKEWTMLHHLDIKFYAVVYHSGKYIKFEFIDVL